MTHRQRETDLIRHVERLLEDDRLRVDTTRGRRAVTTLIRDVNHFDKAVDLKRLMAQKNLPDRDLESKMPTGRWVDVALSRRRFGFIKSGVGHLRVICVSPSNALLSGDEPKPMDTRDVQKVLGEIPPPLRGVPTTLVIMSTSGFTIEAHELTERRKDRTLVLVEPNDAGGWNAFGPVETKALVDLFDPEPEEEKRRRIRHILDEHQTDILTSGIATDKIAAKTQLPLPFIDAELKAYAKENPGLVAKRLEGKVVLFREGASPPRLSANANSGGSDMPLLDRMKALFSRKGENEKKIAFLSERRALLSQQRDRSYEELGSLEKKDVDLRDQFKASTSALSKRRITSQLLQLRKDMERRQQFLQIINQQINVVSTHLHNLELVQQGHTAKLPDSEEMTADAVKAEEMIAQLQADNELAGTVGDIARAGLNDEEQALYEELERESGGESATRIDLEAIDNQRLPTPQRPEPAREKTAPPQSQASPPAPSREPLREREPG